MICFLKPLLIFTLFFTSLIAEQDFDKISDLDVNDFSEYECLKIIQNCITQQDGSSIQSNCDFYLKGENQFFKTPPKEGDLKRDYIRNEYWDIKTSCSTCLMKEEDRGKQKWVCDGLVVCDKKVKDLIHLIPPISNKCQVCRKEDALYSGYFDTCIRRYSYHFKNCLQYCETYPDCNCYWPEKSDWAAQISDFAHDLFKELVISTLGTSFYTNGFCCAEDGKGGWPASEHMKPDKDFPESADYYEYNCDENERFFWSMPYDGFDDSIAATSFICHSFHFSSYINVCQDLYSYCQRNYDEKKCVEVKYKIDELLGKLAQPFLDLYNSCLAKHPNKRIKKEKVIALSYLGLLDLDSFDQVVFQGALSSYFNVGESSIVMDVDYKKPNPLLLEAEFLLAQGTILNSLLLHKEAIVALTKSIQLDPHDKRALLERAAAFFETNQIELALTDYESIKRLILPPFKDGNHLIFEREIYVPKNKIDFMGGLVLGIISGGKIGSEEFIPSLYSSMRGLQNAFWAFAMNLSLFGKTEEIINAAYAVGNFISSKTKTECLECVIPELKELSLTWNEIGDNEKGRKIGFIIGKYGIDILIPCLAMKGVNTFKALKYANTMCTLECCTQSKLKQLKILELSSKHAALRETFIIASVKKGKILVKNKNVLHHIMQKKHAWDKIITYSSNLEKDFQKIIFLLEESQITNESHLIVKQLFPKDFPKISKAIYEKTINGYMVHVEFETYLETGATFLQDAWVVTK